MATSHSFPSRIPVARPSTVPGNTVSSHYKTPRTTTTETLPPNQPLTYSSVPSNEREAVRLRFTCSTPTFNQSTKFSQLARHVQAIPISPMIQRGKDMCARRRFTDHKTGLNKATRVSTAPLNGPPSRFQQGVRRSKKSLRSTETSPAGLSSQGSSPDALLLHEKPLLPPLFSPCTCPIDHNCHDDDAFPVDDGFHPPRRSEPFKIQRKPVPEYLLDIALPSSDSTAAWSSDECGELEYQSPALQNVGRDVFIAYEDDVSFLLTAFTHVIHLVSADFDGTGIVHARRPDVTFETGVHTLRLPIPPPRVQPWLSNLRNIPPPALALGQYHSDIDFSSENELTIPTSRQGFRIHRKLVLGYAAAGGANPDTPSTPADEDSIIEQRLSDLYGHPVGMGVLQAPGSRCVHTVTPPPAVESARLLDDDLLAMQEFPGEYLLSEPVEFSDAPPLGVQPTQIGTALAFLRQRPLAPRMRRRVLVMTPQGQLALEGLAVMACYLAGGVKRCNVGAVLRQFEGTVSRPWRGLLGDDGVVAAYLDELLMGSSGSK